MTGSSNVARTVNGATCGVVDGATPEVVKPGFGNIPTEVVGNTSPLSNGSTGTAELDIDVTSGAYLGELPGTEGATLSGRSTPMDDVGRVNVTGGGLPILTGGVGKVNPVGWSGGNTASSTSSRASTPVAMDTSSSVGELAADVEDDNSMGSPSPSSSLC